nr:MAG TPA: YvrJ protein family protein [Caudoviricetes sp.]
MKINLKLDTSKNKKEGFPLVLSIYVSKTDRLYRYENQFKA